LGDEGVGVHVVRALLDTPGLAGVACLEAGTSGMSALHAMAGMDRVVFVDCAFMGLAPGAVRCFSPDDAVSTASCRRFSLHEGDLLEIIALSRRLGECPPAVRIVGIEPASVAPCEQMSQALRERLPEYLRTVAGELEREA
jgi:hydrogenase maturation protease